MLDYNQIVWLIHLVISSSTKVAIIKEIWLALMLAQEVSNLTLHIIHRVMEIFLLKIMLRHMGLVCQWDL